MDKKVELQVLNITNSQAQVGAFAMLLGEVDGERQLPIIIGPAEAQATNSWCAGSQFASRIDLQGKRWYFLLLHLLKKRRRNYTY